MATILPQYPVSEEDKVPTASVDEQETTTTIPSELGFAQEVRSERLGILWKATMFGAFVLVWMLVVISGGRKFR